MLTPGQVKITDFGIAKVTASEQFTMTGTIVGTPNYMSPEQVQGEAVDGRADQFSLVVIAYEMLTGEKPFTGEQLTTVVYKIVAEDPQPAPRLNATLNAQVRGCCGRASRRSRTRGTRPARSSSTRWRRPAVPRGHGGRWHAAAG